MTLPLRRNTNYHLLWGSQALSELGAQISVFALPLLVLMLTDSAVDAGAAGAVSALTRLVVLVPAGALIDRWHRKRIMLLCELSRVPMMVGLGLMLLGDGVAFGYILAVAVVDGAAAAMFAPAEEAALPQVVTKEQLPTAVSVSAARSYLATLAGPGIGGFLFTAHKALPFLVNGVTYAGSFVMLLFLRLKRPGGAGGTGTAGARRSLVGEIGEGIGWIWRRPVIRASMAVAVGVSVCFNALYLIVLTLAQRAKIPAAEIGAIGVLVGAGGLAGALLAPRMHRLLTPRAAIILLGWLGAGVTPLLLVRTSGYLFGAVLAAIAFLAPTVQTAVVTYQMALTPTGCAGGSARPWDWPAASRAPRARFSAACWSTRAARSGGSDLRRRPPAGRARGGSQPRPARLHLRARHTGRGRGTALSPSPVPSAASDPADAAGPEPTSATSEPLER
ncbi:MFS transporter [Streptomyces noursei]|nr:MFS transporter [Streptomyces noursei]